MAKDTIKTDVTVEEYEFVDANGKHLFTISFHPTDVGIVKRYEKVADYLNNLSAKDLGLDGEDETAAIEAAEKALEERMKPDVQFRYRNSDFCSHEPVHAAGIRKTVCGRDHGKDRGADSVRNECPARESAEPHAEVYGKVPEMTACGSPNLSSGQWRAIRNTNGFPGCFGRFGGHQ